MCGGTGGVVLWRRCVGVYSSLAGRRHAVSDVHDADDDGVRDGTVDHLSPVRRKRQIRVLVDPRRTQHRRTLYAVVSMPFVVLEYRFGLEYVLESSFSGLGLAYQGLALDEFLFKSMHCLFQR